MKTNRLVLWTAIAGAGLAASLGCASTSGELAAQGPAEGDRSQVSVQPEQAESEVVLHPIYFEYDEWILSNEARSALRSNATLVQQHPEWGTLTIEGHCDERGSDEYNFALGQRRAAAVKSYLVDLGVPAARFETVSFGEHQPAVKGHDESAWRYNRRSELASEERQASSR